MPRPDRPAQAATNDRAAKIEQMRKEARNADRRRTAVIWAAALAVIALVGGLVTWQVSQDSGQPDMAAVKSYDNLARNHVTTKAIRYGQTPPAGGDHNAAWWNCGIYTEEIPAYHAVHSLEHGAVWLTYQPGLPEDQLKVLEDLASDEYMILSPVKDQKAPVMATAWGKQLSVETASDERVKEFIRDYRQGPQTPEPGAACTGGTTQDLAA